MKELTEKDLIKYFYTFRELVFVHREVTGGIAPRLAENFTEPLCAMFFDLDRAKYKTRGYDLEDRKTKNKIEVKATSSQSGTTTINLNSDFAQLYWLYFNWDEKKVVVRIINRDEFKQSSSNQQRVTIQLKNKKECAEYELKFTKKKIKKITIK